MKRSTQMRFAIITSLAFIVGIGMLAGCNSKDVLVSQAQKTVQEPQAPPTQPSPPADNARRITAEDLYKLWEKHDVLIIDTRAESAYKDEHIKGAISVPSNEVADRVDE